MSEFYTAFTVLGRQKMMAATLSEPLAITEMAVGFDADDAVYASDADFPVGFSDFEQWRGGISGDAINAQNLTWREVTATIPGDVGGFKINRIALFDADGDMVVFGVIPLSQKPLPSQGVVKPLSITAIFAWDNPELGSVTIAVADNHLEINALRIRLEQLEAAFALMSEKVAECCNSTVEGTYFDAQSGYLVYESDGQYQPLDGVDFSIEGEDLIATGDNLPDLNINPDGGLEVNE